MLSKQVKSSCCKTSVVRFGGRRRKCRQCGRTWRIRQKSRGRKPFRLRYQYLNKVFDEGLQLRQIITTRNVSKGAIRKRFEKVLNRFVEAPRVIKLPKGRLILIIDARWHKFKGRNWTLYCFALKSVDKDEALILDPVVLFGKESTEAWERIIASLPLQLRKRIIAVVSDGIRGFNRVIVNYGWKWQRCHFHLISALEKRRGKRMTTTGREVREKIYRTVRELLVERRKKRVQGSQNLLKKLITDPDCPKRMKMIVSGFLREFSFYRTYLDFPELNLPATTGLMESINSRLTKKALTVRTPDSWRKWTIAIIRYKPIFNCKRTNYQPN